MISQIHLEKQYLYSNHLIAYCQHENILYIHTKNYTVFLFFLFSVVLSSFVSSFKHYIPDIYNYRKRKVYLVRIQTRSEGNPFDWLVTIVADG